MTHVQGGAGDAAAVLQRLLGGGDLVRVARAEADGGAFFEEGLDDGPPDAAGATGDEDASAVELQIHGADLSQVVPSERARPTRSAWMPPNASTAGSSALGALTTTL